MELRAERERRLSRARVERHRQAETDIWRQGRHEDDRRRQGVLRQQETCLSESESGRLEATGGRVASTGECKSEVRVRRIFLFLLR